MSTIHVKHGLEFKPELYKSHNRTNWLEAVGQELENKEIVIQLDAGGQSLEIGNTAELKSFYERYEAEPEQVASELGLEPGQEIQRYISDLVQALDDVVKSSSSVKAGTRIDLSPTSEMSKMLGLDDSSVRYASSRSAFGDSSRAEGATSVLGVMLSREAAPVDPLAGEMFIDAATFEGQSMKSGRRNEEFEAVRRLGGLDKDQLIELLRSERGGKTILKRIRKAKDAEAFSVGYSGVSLDEMRWDSRAHKIREEIPYVSLTVESGRLNVDEDDGEYEVDLGTDYNEDAYYDTNDYTLLDNDMTVRGRIRRDDADPSDSAVRRVLIQSKIGSSVDEGGTKSASKADIRKDSPSADDIAGLDEDVRTGISGWGWGMNNEQPIEALGLVHTELASRGKLPTIGEHKDVMQLEAKAHVRSTRSRFHFNETNRNSSVTLFKNAGEPNIKATLELLEGNTELSPANAEALKTLGEGLLDKSAILERTQDALMALDPELKQNGVTADTIESLWPDSHVTSDKLATKKRRVVADAIKEAYDEFAGLVDDHREAIAGASTDEVQRFDMTDEIIEFMKEKETTMRSTMTVGPFLEEFDKKLSGPDKQAFIDEFSAWAKDEGRSELSDAADKDAALGNIRSNMVSEHLDIVHRQIEASGSTGQNLWFDSARKAYADSSRSYGNFLIDTFDVSEFYTPEVWESLTDEQRAGADDVPADKMYHAMVVNEVQIELRSEEPFMKAIAKHEGSIQNAKAGIVMDFALQQGGSVVADKPETFETWIQNLQQLPQGEQEAMLQELNQFAADKGSVLTLDAGTLGSLDASLLTSSNQGQDYGVHAGHVDDLEMVNFVWGEMIGTQEYIADLRGRRVKREAERAGFDDVKWENSTLSKGDTALKLQRDGEL